MFVTLAAAFTTLIGSSNLKAADSSISHFALDRKADEIAAFVREFMK
jgi:hypothetical protein